MITRARKHWTGAAGRCLSFCWWLPGPFPSLPFRDIQFCLPIQKVRCRPSSTFLSISGPEKSSQMWRVGGGLSVTKLTSIVNHRNRQFSRPSRPAEYWKPGLGLFASSDVNNSLTLDNWQSQTCINPFSSQSVVWPGRPSIWSWLVDEVR